MSTYTTHDGVVQEKVNIFFTVPELEMLQELANEFNTPIGNLLVQLARTERRRIKSLA
jgi:hypothetical protein